MKKHLSGKHRLSEFFLLSFIFSWLVWIAIILLEPSEDLLLPFILLGAFGPSLIAILLMQVKGNKEEQRDFWDRTINYKRILWKWYLVILLVFPLILILGYGFYSLIGGELPLLSDFFGGITSIGDFFMLMVIMLLGGPLAEELGWRGYSMDLLQEKWGKVTASLILGIVWVVWHLPLFFIEGTSQHQKGFGIAFWSWTLQILLISLIFTWVYNHTNRSILGAVLLHLMANFFYPLNLDAAGEIVFSLIRIFVVTLVVLSWSMKGKAPLKTAVPGPV